MYERAASSKFLGQRVSHCILYLLRSKNIRGKLATRYSDKFLPCGARSEDQRLDVTIEYEGALVPSGIYGAEKQIVRICKFFINSGFSLRVWGWLRVQVEKAWEYLLMVNCWKKKEIFSEKWYFFNK